MQRIASDNKPAISDNKPAEQNKTDKTSGNPFSSDDIKAEQNKTHKTPSDHWFGAMVFGGGLAVVAVLALPLAVPAIAVGAGAVGLGAVASSTAIGLGFVTTGAVAGGALGYNYGNDVIVFIDKNITNQNKVAESSTQSEATPQQKEKALAFVKKFMEFRIQEVDKILNDKSTKDLKKTKIESFLDGNDKSFSLDIAKDKLYIPEDEKEKCKELFEKKAPTCFDIVSGDIERYKENMAKLREDRQGVATDEKIIKELSKIITHKFKIKSLLSAGEDEAVVDKVKNFSKEFESYWKNTGDKQATSLIEKDVEAIKEILKESAQKGGYQNEAHIYFETSAEPKKETPSATPRASDCFGFVFGSKIVGSDQLKTEELRSSPMKNNEIQTEKSHGPQVRTL